MAGWSCEGMGAYGDEGPKIGGFVKKCAPVVGMVVAVAVVAWVGGGCGRAAGRRSIGAASASIFFCACCPKEG